MTEKFKYIYSLVIALASSLLLVSCGGEDGPDIPEPDTPADRTVLVYMIANNNLGYSSAHFDLNDIAEMEQAARAGALGNSRLLVFHHSYTQPEPQLIEITSKGAEVKKTYRLTSSSASEAMMRQVISDMKAIAPAGRYGIILWSHASGWLNTGVDTPLATPRSFGYDGRQSNTMSVTSLASVLTGNGFDYIYFDCCYMSAVEVAYELREAATWMIGSAAELPSNGTPYHLALPYLMPREADPAGAARTTFNYYAEHYNPYSDINDQDKYGATFSAIYLPEMQRVADAAKAVYSRKYSIGNPRLVQQFAPATNRNDFVDLADMVAHFQGVTAAETAAVDDALSSAVRFKGATEGIHMMNSFTVKKHCGLSTMMPVDAASFTRDNYSLLQWYRDVAYLME